MADVTLSADIDAFLVSANNSAARTNLGVAIGSDVQAYSAKLAAAAALSGDIVGTSDSQTLTNKTMQSVDGTASVPAYSFASDTDSGLMLEAAGNVGIVTSGVQRFRFGATGRLSLTEAVALGGSLGVPNTYLFGDAANVLSLRNGVNAATLNIFNTYTDGSNYERGFAKWNSNTFELGTESAGTGSARNVAFYRDSDLNMRFESGGVYFARDILVASSAEINWSNGVDYSRAIVASGNGLAITNASSSGEHLEFREMTAPSPGSATSVRIFAEDNGSGKTRLMAQFGTGAAQQITIEP